MDPFKDLYNAIAERKQERLQVNTYDGNNGRINRAVELINNDFSWQSSDLSVLDVGGATGNLGYALKDSNFKTKVVVDIVESCREPAESKGCKFYCANVDTDGLPFDESTFDLVVALDLIEHIIDPEKFARECYRVLKNGGFVLINTPNIQFWRHLHSLVVDGVFPHTSGDKEVYHGGHVAFYNLRDLITIFSKAGFKSHQMHTRVLNPDPPSPIWANISKISSKEMSYADLIYSSKK